jgi:hypothetical protein
MNVPQPHASGGFVSENEQMTAFLANVIGAVEANSYEKLMLWDANTRLTPPRIWKENNSGLLEVVGRLADMPVCIGLWTAEIDGHKILFYDATSQVVDYRMIDNWLETNLPKTAFRKDGYVNKTDAMNFRNIFPRS